MQDPQPDDFRLKSKEYETFTRLLRREYPSRYTCIRHLTSAVFNDTDLEEWDEDEKNHLIIETINTIF